MPNIAYPDGFLKGKPLWFVPCAVRRLANRQRVSQASVIAAVSTMLLLRPIYLAVEADFGHLCFQSLIVRNRCLDRIMAEYHAGRLDLFTEGGRRLLKCGDAEIGIFMINGELHAWHNECAHRGGPVCQGRIMRRVMEPLGNNGTVRSLEYHGTDIHLICPWHGYEYNIKSGEHPGHAALKLRKASITIRNGEVYVVLG
jgi:nitrite reductase (NADH) small subunit